jgi:tetratricopeptide (TPR) repeat protein
VEQAPASGSRREVMVLSDHWIEQEVLHLLLDHRQDEALERARLWTQIRPDRLRPTAALIRALHAAGRLEERDRAVADLLAAQSRDLNELEEGRLALGQLRLWKPQVVLLDQMDALAPGHPVILANRGAAYLEIGENARGARDLEAAIKLDPDNGPALANLGLERMRQDEYSAARELLEHAVAVAPDQPLARIYLAACKNNQNDRAGAIHELQEALRLDPENAQALQLLAELESHGARAN